mmetsp:Transcript_3302/g.6050  ORF Transcript_3302/g.6050 Transcript_3302/m.6050 type:complete len:158 (-) Transcript_3302:18-491(-)
MSSKLSPWLLSLALCAVAAQAADTPPPPVIVQKPALSAQGADLKVTLAVDKLKVSMLQGDDMGGTSFGWFCANRQPMAVNENYIKNYGGFMSSVATQELKRLGYPLAGKGQANAFDVDVAAAPDFRIGGILTEAKHEVCWLDNRAEGWIYYKVDWAL